MKVLEARGTLVLGVHPDDDEASYTSDDAWEVNSRSSSDIIRSTAHRRLMVLLRSAGGGHAAFAEPSRVDFVHSAADALACNFSAYQLVYIANKPGV